MSQKEILYKGMVIKMIRISKPLSLSFVIIIFAAITALCICAGNTLTEGVSILNPKQNIHGDGYEWHNPSDTLTLTNLKIDTDDEYGLKIADGATVILKGNNYIKASKAALYIGGNVVIRGSGTLTLEGGETGILCNSIKNTDKLSITEGTYNINGGIDGIRADFSRVALSGGKLTVSGGSGYAINVRELQTSAGVTIKATGTLYSSYSMLIQGTNLTVESSQPALLSDGTLKTESMTIKTGTTLSALSDADSYSGENAITTISTLDTSIKSILFGAPYSIAVDITLLIAAIAVLAAAIVIPPVIRKKEAQSIIKSLEAAEAEKKQQKKIQKKSAIS